MVVRQRAERTLLWRVWDRMLEIEFVDRSVALAGKAFVSFFPLVIVVASFAPQRVRASIFSTLTHRLGIGGAALVTAKEAFSSADDIRKATGILGLVLTLFFASSFTTALQRVYLRAWRRPPGGKAGEYARGPAWVLVVLASMAVLGGLRAVLGDGPQVTLFILISLAVTSALWWFTAWFMLMGQVRWRVLVPIGCHHRVGDRRLRTLGGGLDVKRGHTERGPVRVLRRRARTRDVVLGRVDLRPHRGVRGGGLRRRQPARSAPSSGEASPRCWSRGPHHHFPPPRANAGCATRSDPPRTRSARRSGAST